MPFAILLIPYAVFLVFFIIVTLSALYHLIRFKFITPITIAGTIVFLILTIVILAISGSAMSGIDWNAKIFSASDSGSKIEFSI